MFQAIPMQMGIGMGMPMMMPMQYPFMGNPFDQGMDLEYSPITQLVSSIAHLVEMHQKSKERLGDHEDSSHHALFPQLQELQQAIQMRGRPGGGGAHFNLIPYTHDGDQVPPVMWRIGDLIGKNSPNQKDKENLYDMTKVKGFPIIKGSEDSVHDKFRDAGGGGETKMMAEEKEKKSWTVLEIARKVLGVDELPTASEGNAIAQLLEELRKEKRSETNSNANLI